MGTDGDTNVHTTVNCRGRSRLSRRPRPGIANIVSAVVTWILRIGSLRALAGRIIAGTGRYLSSGVVARTRAGLLSLDGRDAPVQQTHVAQQLAGQRPACGWPGSPCHRGCWSR
jgi:hypothetical protein